ncbi:MAG: DUF4932 domain-containing protein [Bacteroidetes bacterium]|nr:DUF4932 domain-containing protein [Bacteroidota bacterium]
MKCLWVSFLLFFAGSVRSQPPVNSNLTITVNEGIELLSVVQYLGGHLDNNTPSVYRDEVRRYFGRYRIHPAVMTMFNFNYRVYTDLVECGLVFYDFPEIKMRPLPDSCSWFKYMGRAVLEGYLRQCMQFYRDTRFHDFYRAHLGMFSQWAGSLRDSIDGPIRVFDSLINTRRDHHWMVCMDPLNDWGAHTIMPRNVNMRYRDHFIYELGYMGDTDRQGRMVFGADLYNFAWHEGTHAFTDSILGKMGVSIDSLSGLMPSSAQLRRQNINDWGHYFNELIPRAVSLALHKEFRSPEAYRKLLEVEERNGFVHVKMVSEVIYADFIHERRVDSFEGLLRRIIVLLGN